MRAIRWLGKNLSAFLLAFLLGIAVWISAVTATDPNLERTFEIEIETVGQEENTEIISEIPENMELILYAPSSNLNKISRLEDDIQASIDLTGLGEGVHDLPIQYQLPTDIRPVREISATPNQVEIIIEELITTTITLSTDIIGEPALGYQAETPIWSNLETTLSGRSSLIQQVSYIEAVLDISGATETFENTIILVPRDSDGRIIQGLDLEPDKVTVVQPITLKGGYRNLVVKVVTIGQVADGYRQTNITVTPPNVMLFSADPSLLDQLPGYVETEVLDISEAIDDIETVLTLNLPEGISVIGDDRVIVMVGVAAIEDSVTISRDVEIIGLRPGLEAQVAPQQVDILIAGPIPDLENITPVDVRAVLDLSGLEAGTYQLAPVVEILPDNIYLQSISPETVEVIIQEQPTPTVSPTPNP
jgi:YbbR domain-containing protein